MKPRAMRWIRLMTIACAAFSFHILRMQYRRHARRIAFVASTSTRMLSNSPLSSRARMPGAMRSGRFSRITLRMRRFSNSYASLPPFLSRRSDVVS